VQATSETLLKELESQHHLSQREDAKELSDVEAAEGDLDLAKRFAERIKTEVEIKDRQIQEKLRKVRAVGDGAANQLHHCSIQFPDNVCTESCLEPCQLR
jgi:hypothetical protein